MHKTHNYYFEYPSSGKNRQARVTMYHAYLLSLDEELCNIVLIQKYCCKFYACDGV